MQVLELYETVRISLESALKFESSFLAESQDLLTSCLRSRHKPILRQSILMWNRTFGAADSLNYPERLQKVLLKLKDVADVRLPGFSDLVNTEVSRAYRVTVRRVLG